MTAGLRPPPEAAHEATSDQYRRPVRVPIWSLVVVACCWGVVACGEGAVTRQQAVESFQVANPDATAEQSGCVVDALIDQYGLEELADQLEADPVDPAFEESQFSQMFLCGMEGDVRDQISTQLEDAGVAADDAPCVADALVTSMDEDDVGVLLSGEITDSFAEKFYDALESCDALNPS